MTAAPAVFESTTEHSLSPDIISELAPTGVVRAGINLSNFLLVTSTDSRGIPLGVAPDLARELATWLGVPVQFVTFKSPGELADMADQGVWDIGLIGAEPQRAEKIERDEVSLNRFGIPKSGRF